MLITEDMMNKPNLNEKMAKAKEIAALRKSKISSRRLHLKNLIQKKARIEIEIKGILKTLRKEGRAQRKALTENFGLDPNDEDLDEKLANFVGKDPELKQILQEGNDQLRAISTNLEDSEFLVSSEREHIHNLFF